MTKKFYIPPFFIGVIDFLLLNISFFAMYYWKRGTLDLSSRYAQLLIATYLIWIFVSLLTKKFRLIAHKNYWDGIFLYVKSGVYAAYCAAVIVVMMGLTELSRVQVFGTWGLLVVQEVVVFSICWLTGDRSRIFNEETGKRIREKYSFSRFLLVSDFVLIGISFFIMNYLKRGHIDLLPEYEKLLYTIWGLWLIVSLATRKYVRRPFQNFYHAVWPWLKAVILMVAVMSIVVFGLRLFYLSRAQVFGTILVLGIFEVLFYRLYFVIGKRGKNDKDIESVADVKTILRQEDLHLEVDIEKIRRLLLEPIRAGLKDKYLKDYPGLFDMIDQSVNLSEIIQAETTLVNSNDMFNLMTINRWPVRLFINLRKINDVRRINRYFLEVHNTLMNGGYFFGMSHTIDTHRKWLFKKYPKYIANGIYFIDFIINRVFPKFPWIKQVYFSFTKGRDRILSKAEVLGRLSFCGFEIVAEKEINERLWFIARKIKTVSDEKDPSYGPLVKLNRTGIDCEPITVYKFRTMHPYSEFLQKYMYEKSSLRVGGKFKNDFRVTEWGKIMRKMWIDELPMLYNWIRGELKLVGVRPLSSHYLSLYDNELQEMRKNTKPGLIPPFYVDLPKTFNEICESEKRYIKAYLRNPVRTQWWYFWKAFGNIVFRGARSG